MFKNPHRQKRLLLCNLKELYLAFKSNNPGPKVGISRFCSLRRNNGITVGRNAGTHLVYGCSLHQNVILLLSAIGLKDMYDNFLEMIVCNNNNQNCMICHCKKNVLGRKTYTNT